VSGWETPLTGSDDPVHRAWMTRALALARQGLYSSRPNPAVGCVVVREGRCVGEGFHARPGEPHAEIMALRQAGAEALGADLYVTLEPCAHVGRTGPCVEAVIHARPRCVIIAAKDPHPMARGGLERLEQAGIPVVLGVCETEARELNAGFFSAHERGRPFVRCKVASSLDGHTALASGESRWITGPESRESVQDLRARSGALVTGIGTVLADNPRLTVRDRICDPPIRVILDRAFRLPRSAQLFEEPGPIWWIGSDRGTPDPIIAKRCEVVAQWADSEAWPRLLSAFYDAEIWDVCVEAGPTLSGALLSAHQIDELWCYLAPCWMGLGSKPFMMLNAPETMGDLERWKTVSVDRLGDDVRWVLRPS
jgi:diaminohydroxyphosphoribosylaminopyrimidine deaminase / 5-amino-6-(5-phosphoribosylamino)uracil reductase